jgi:hypothetical protein
MSIILLTPLYHMLSSSSSLWSSGILCNHLNINLLPCPHSSVKLSHYVSLTCHTGTPSIPRVSPSPSVCKEMRVTDMFELRQALTQEPKCFYWRGRRKLMNKVVHTEHITAEQVKLHSETYSCSLRESRVQTELGMNCIRTHPGSW